MALKMLEQFDALYRVSTPLIGITGPDPAQTIATLRGKYGKDVPMVQWDTAVGLRAINEKAGPFMKLVEKKMPPGTPVAALTSQISETLGILEDAPEDSIICLINVHRQVNEPVPAQGIWNLRDLFKSNGRTLVLLGPEMVLPAELSQDVIMLEQPMPTDAELGEIVKLQFQAAKAQAQSMPDPSEELILKGVTATRGLAAFPAEQVTVSCIKKDGSLDLGTMRDLRRKAIEQTRGLRVVRSTLTMGDMGGLDSFKLFGKRLFSGKRAPAVLLFWDEIEKMIAGVGTKQGGGDSSGVSTDQLGVALKKMIELKITGVIALGVPGSGKSAMAQAWANSFNVECLEMDFGAMKGQYVGQSEGYIRAAWRTVEAVAGVGGAFVYATCNKLDILPTELRRRFTTIYYFDLPTKAEKETIWVISLKKYGISPADPRPDDTNWTGAEIDKCCDIADRFGCTLIDAAKNIVPVAQSDPENLAALRRLAHGRFLDVSREGTFQAPDFMDASTMVPATASGRKVR